MRCVSLVLEFGPVGSLCSIFTACVCALSRIIAAAIGTFWGLLMTLLLLFAIGSRCNQNIRIRFEYIIIEHVLSQIAPSFKSVPDVVEGAGVRYFERC